MGYQRNGGSQAEATSDERENSRREPNPPVFTRKIWTPSGTIELAVFEKQVEGKKKDHTTFFVTLKRSYFVPGDKRGEGEWKETGMMNPQDLLICSDLYKIAWDFILEECNRQ